MKCLLIAAVFGCSRLVFAKPPAASSFAANSFVSGSIKVVLNHAKEAIAKHDEKNIVGVFPPDAGSKARVDIFNDLPVKMSRSLITLGSILLHGRYGH